MVASNFRWLTDLLRRVSLIDRTMEKVERRQLAQMGRIGAANCSTPVNTGVIVNKSIELSGKYQDLK